MTRRGGGADQDLHAAAFPRLDQAQLAALEGCPLSKLAHHRDGEKLFEAGQWDGNVYVVRTGAVEILDDAGDEPTVVATLGHGEFTGEVAQLTGARRSSAVSPGGRATSSRFRTMPCVRS